MTKHKSEESEPLEDEDVEIDPEALGIDEEDKDLGDKEEPDDDDEDGESGETKEAVEEEEDDEDELLAAAEAEEPDEVDPYFEEAAGYSATFDWSSIPPEERELHEQILHSDEDELRALNIKRTGLFDRWAAAQAFARHGMRKEFQESCRTLLKSRRRHDALQYEDIYLELISDLAEAGEHKEAFEFLEKFHKGFPDEEHVYQRVHGLLLIESGDIHEGKSKLDELMASGDDRGYLHLEIGDDLVSMGHAEMALRILGRGKDFARRNSDTELMTAIDETRRLAIAKIEGEDF